MKRVESKLVDNEALFRRYNENVERGLKNLQKIAADQNWQDDVKIDDKALYFYCECSDENCRQRIVMRPSKYRRIHADRHHFIVINGHQVPMVEKVVEINDDYSVVRKYNRPPESTDHLQSTPINNT